MSLKILRKARADNIRLIMWVENGYYGFRLTTWKDNMNFASKPSPTVGSLTKVNEWFDFLTGSLMLKEMRLENVDK